MKIHSRLQCTLSLELTLQTVTVTGVNKPPQLPMDNRRESQTAGESTVNAIFRPSNVPAYPSSQAPSNLTQSTYPMPRGSAASLPANEVRILLLHVVF